MRQLFDSPLAIILILLLVLLFGAKRLPDAARGLGRSLRILKAETKGLHDDEPTDAAPVTPPAQAAPAPAAPAPAPAAPAPATAAPATPVVPVEPETPPRDTPAP